MVHMRTKILLLSALVGACTKDVGKISYESNYPNEISEIMLSKCSISGCHNEISKSAAAGLSLASWESLFKGGRGGSVVIPFRSDFSTLCYYTNSSPELGPSLTPRMPLGKNPLTTEEYDLIKNWIKNGAPDKKGMIKFSGIRNKLYVTNQICDNVTIIDGETQLPMRYVDVGRLSKTEFPVCIKTTPDGKAWYVSFLASTILQKFEALSDAYVSELDLGNGIWSSFEISKDGAFAFCTDDSDPGQIVRVNLNTWTLEKCYKSADLIYPRSPAIHNSLKKLYVGAEAGNCISVIDYSDSASGTIKQISLDGAIPHHESSLDPICVYVEESRNLCFVACRGSKEIKVIDTEKDLVINSFFLNASPTFMDYSRVRKQLFVTCNDDSLSFPDNTGSVKIIDLESNQIIKTVNPGYQPNGICINERFGYALVVNSNISPKGPHPHHVSACAGRNGYITFIDLSTLELVKDARYELAVYPYAAAVGN